VPVNVEKRKADRLRVLQAIFDAASGIEDEPVRLAPTIQSQLDLSAQDLQAACAYLVGEGLIKPIVKINEAPAYISASLTHRGAIEMERSISSPDKPTKHLPSVNSVITIINSTLHNSPIQSASPEGRQTS